MSPYGDGGLILKLSYAPAALEMRTVISGERLGLPASQYE
jgi:hypothetical protein